MSRNGNVRCDSLPPTLPLGQNKLRKFLNERCDFIMITIDDAEIMLEEIAEELPEEFFQKLNGGILLLPDVKMHPARRADDLYILGEYNRRHDMGRYINIYFGSLERTYGHLPPEKFKEQLKRVLVHEFTHHIENLAGERGLEIKDEQDMRKYRDRYNT